MLPYQIIVTILSNCKRTCATSQCKPQCNAMARAKAQQLNKAAHLFMNHERNFVGRERYAKKEVVNSRFSRHLPNFHNTPPLTDLSSLCPWHNNGACMCGFGIVHVWQDVGAMKVGFRHRKGGRTKRNSTPLRHRQNI